MHAAFYPVFCDSIAVRLTKWRISLVLCYLLLYMVVVILFPVWGLQRRSQDFCLGGGHPVHFPSSLREPAAFSGGGGGYIVAEIFRVLSVTGSDSVGGGVVAEIFRALNYRIRFSGGGGGSTGNFAR